MKIQLITGNRNFISDDNISVSNYDYPLSPDDYDINVIDLSYPRIWRSDRSEIGHIEIYDDLKFLSKMITESAKCKIVYVYPKDGEYLYYHYGNSYKCKKRIKDLIVEDNYDLGYKSCFSVYSSCVDVIFEPTITKIENIKYSADFRFIYENGTVITKSEKSGKSTTVQFDERFFYTTLDICSSVEKLNLFINKFLVDSVSEIPEWVKEYEFLNDRKTKDFIEVSKNQIEKLNNQIEKAESILSENNRYKSILFTNGEQLVQVVFEILEKIFDCDLSGFKDERKEDFLIEKENAIFVGEIKGVTSNVKNEFISQLELHCQKYMDDLTDKFVKNTVHGILVINPFRTTQLLERKPVHEEQIDLAKRYGSVIIETVTLLKIFELHQKGILTSDDIIEKLQSFKGLLHIDDLI